MLNISNNEICANLWKIIAHFGGYANQKEKAIEELGELQQALARDLQGEGNRENIIEEMADVAIMLSQLLLIYGISPGKFGDVLLGKYHRTLERIDAEKGVDEGRRGAACYARREAGT